MSIGKAVGAGLLCKDHDDCLVGSCVDGQDSKKVCQGDAAAESGCTHNSDCASNSCVLDEANEDGPRKCAGKYPLRVAVSYLLYSVVGFA